MLKSGNNLHHPTVKSNTKKNKRTASTNFIVNYYFFVFQAHIYESDDVGVIVTQVRAYDVDDVEFGDVTYRQHGARNYFATDLTTVRTFVVCKLMS